MELTKLYLDECFNYDCDSGELFWKERPLRHFSNSGSMRSFNIKYSGSVAGYKRFDKYYSYVYIRISGIKLEAHRIIMTMISGEFPSCVDHINGDGHDNRIENLREASNIKNARNQKLNCKSKYGIMGIGILPSGKFRVRIGGGDNRVHLGLFDDFFEACCCRKSAEYAIGYHKNHGRV